MSKAKLTTTGKVRSFVLRAGRVTKAQQRALDKLLPLYQLPLPDSGTVDFSQIFANQNPVTLEIGFGMGHSLVALAQANPQMNFVGIEVHPPGVGRLLNEVHQLGLKNIRILQTDAVEVLRQWIAPASLHKLLLFFPDPWPKKRHHKRRIVQEEFVKLVADALAPGGLFHLATDWEPYAQWMLEKCASEPRLVNQSPSGDFVPRPASRPVTKFERRGTQLGHVIRDLVYQKVASD